MTDSSDTEQAPPTCDFSATDLAVDDEAVVEADLSSWTCSRPVWGRTEDARCVWHTDVEDKPVAPLKQQLGAGDIHGAVFPSDTDLGSVTFPDEVGLVGADLSGATLDGVDLAGATLFGADLIDVDLQGADLSTSDLSEAILSDGDLSEANLFGATLSEASLLRADFSEASLNRTDLSGANLGDANLSGANLTLGDLSGAKLWGANLTDASLKGADLSGTRLWEADISGADLSGGELRDGEISSADLSRADLDDGVLSGANLSGVNLSDAELTNADLSEATLSGAAFAGADAENADFSEATVRRADFSAVDLRETLLPTTALFGPIATTVDADLRKAPVDDTVTIRGSNPATLVEADLRRADLEGGDLGFVDLREATLTSADCENTRFDEANLNRATLENADLTGADFSQAYLYQTRLVGAQIDYQTQFHPDGNIGDLTTPNRCRYDSEMPPDTPARTIEPEATVDAGESAELLRVRRARSTYSRLEDLATQSGFPNLKSEMYIQKQEARRELLFAQNQRLKAAFAQAQKWLLGYGESFRRIIEISAVTVALLWGVYMTGGIVETGDGDPIVLSQIVDDPVLVYDTLLHSASVFFAGNRLLETTGRIGESVVVLESMVGPILVALLIFVLGRRAAR